MRRQVSAILSILGLIIATLLVAWWLCPQERPQTVQNVPSPVPMPTPSAPAISIQESGLVEFQRYTETLLTQIPSASDLREQDFSAHSAPIIALQFAPKLAHVHDVMRADSRHIAIGRRFFEKCALEDKALVTIRAVCFRLLRRWDKNTEVQVPDEIATISKQLPGDDL